MRKIGIIITSLALVAALFLGLVRYQKNKKMIFTIDWYEITPETYSDIQPELKKLPSIYVEAFTPLVKPYVYATDPRLTNISEKQSPFIEQKVITGITESLLSEWNKKIDQLYRDLQDKHINAAYLSIAKDSQRNIIGFSLFKESPIKNILDSKLLSIIEGPYEKINSTHTSHDEVYVVLIAVIPGIQKRGVGKTLLLSIFDHYPHLKKIYLTTSASDFNKNARSFYEHIGFTKVLKGSFIGDEETSDFGKEKIVYIYNNKPNR